MKTVRIHLQEESRKWDWNSSSDKALKGYKLQLHLQETITKCYVNPVTICTGWVPIMLGYIAMDVMDLLLFVFPFCHMEQSWFYSVDLLDVSG